MERPWWVPRRGRCFWARRRRRKGGYGCQATSAPNHGVAGITAHAEKAGVLATHNGPAGNGAALVAHARNNSGAIVKNCLTTKPALLATATSIELVSGNFDAVGISVGWGNVNVNGELTKSSGAFRIDHPLDPANKDLSHSFVESPDMSNLYQGVETADAKGEFVVELPKYFDALNKDFRYQLTPIGGPAPELHVKREIADYSRGTYLFPKGFGQPETERLGYRKPTSGN